MGKRVLLVFDIAILTGFGVYMALTLWRLPEELRNRILAASLGLVAQLTRMIG